MNKQKLNWFDRMMIDVTFAEAGIDIVDRPKKKLEKGLNTFTRTMAEAAFAEAGVSADLSEMMERTSPTKVLMVQDGEYL